MCTSVMKQKALSLVKRLIASVLKNYVYTIKHGLGKGFKRKGDFGFLRLEGLTSEERFLLSLELEGKTVYDVGSYVGVTVMFFARAVGDGGMVVAFEPNPENFAKLQENLMLNGIDNVKAMRIALGGKRESGILMAHMFDSARGIMDKKWQSQFLKEKGWKHFHVDVWPLDLYIKEKHLPEPDFVKIDVEGMEYEVLLGMKNTVNECKPPLLIEMHGIDEADKIKRAQKIVDLLTLYGYCIYHVESEKTVYKIKEQTARGHIFCYAHVSDKTCEEPGTRG